MLGTVVLQKSPRFWNLRATVARSLLGRSVVTRVCMWPYTMTSRVVSLVGKVEIKQL